MYTSGMYVQSEIDGQYRRLQARAKLGRAIGQIMGRSSTLRSLAQTLDGYRVCAQHYEGLKTVALSRIVGSEGRCKDFDGDYRPLTDHTQQRWYSVARAQLTGVTLPPVDLIRIGDEYYVRDGNHRVSVARAFGQAAIDALVTEWQLAPQAAPQTPVTGWVAA